MRFSGPGPYITPDIDDVGFMSMSIKLMGVPGPKLMDDELSTQDMVGVSTPTFVTPDTRANARLQHWSYQNAQIFYFLDPRDSHILDSIMQLLWTKTQSSPLEGEYFSCVPYLLGEGQAMQFSFRTRLKKRTRVPRLPLRPPDNYLRDAMVGTLAKQDVEFDILLQLQTDPFRMPIENNAVLWPTKLSPRVPAAVLRIPKQKFDSPEQLAFARVLTLQPVAFDPRAPSARKPEPGQEAHVLRARTAPAEDERGRALRADRRRGVSWLGSRRRAVVYQPRDCPCRGTAPRCTR